MGGRRPHRELLPRAQQPPPAGQLPTDPDWWRHRHQEAQTDHDQTPTRPRAAKPRHRVESIPEDFLSAVDVLIGGRDSDFHGLAVKLLEPLKLQGGAIADLRDVMDGFAERVRASHGTTRTALLCAADLVILVTAFCEAVGASGIRFETEHGYEESDLVTDVVAELERVTLGSRRVSHPSYIRGAIDTAYTYAADTVYEAANGGAELAHELALRAWRRYAALLADATWRCPELRLTSDTEDPPEALDPPPAPVPGPP
ncbi:hypothetical protein ACFV5E_42845 [Streptomyces chartreusis]|uniref:NACHT N-terminal helical domain 7-containing protein n=1 Tax=Streptomyces chartreusis TaxID=1969 RepID=UPI00368395EA